MNKKNTLFLVLFFSLVIQGCKERAKTTNLAAKFTVSLEESILKNEKKSNKTLRDKYLKEVKLIPLQTTEESMLSEGSIVQVTSDYIAITNNNALYFFDAENGRFLSKVDRIGDGPEEYSCIFSLDIDPMSRKVYIPDFNKKKIFIYNFDGSYISELKNDSIASIALTPDGYWGHNFPSRGKYEITYYDKEWKPLKFFFHREKTPGKSDFIRVGDFERKLDGRCYTWTDEPQNIYEISKDEISLYLQFKLKSLLIPEEIRNNLSRESEANRYVNNLYADFTDKVVFLQYFYDKKMYFDVWDYTKDELLYRNTASSGADFYGVKMNYEGKELCLWPKYVEGNVVYGLLLQEEVDEFQLFGGNEGNPVLFKVECK